MSSFSAKSVATWVLVHWCSALLPPIPDDERDYYEILDVPPNASIEDIRRAYKKKSLQLHPDKIAQRGNSPSQQEQAAAEYQLVQEAHAVLSDAEKRQTYHAVLKSPTRYRFVSSGGVMMHPQEMYHNLGRASFWAKSRIVFLGVLLVGMILLQPILIAVKINHINNEGGGALENTKWVVVLIPLWILQGALVAYMIWAWLFLLKDNNLSAAATSDNNNTSCSVVALIVLEHVSWLAGEVVSSLRWDDIVTSKYAVVSVPFYTALFLRITSALWTMRRTRRRIGCMISQVYLDQKVLEGGRPYDDLTEDERRALESQYVLVHVPADFAAQVQVLEGLDDEDDLEALRVQASPEYHDAVTVYGNAVQKLMFVLLCAAPFCGMVVAKVDGAIDVSWWVIFVPFWTHMGFRFLSSLYRCCCGEVSGSEVVLGGDEEENDGDHGDNDNDDAKAQTREADNAGNADNAFAMVEGSMSEFLKNHDNP